MWSYSCTGYSGSVISYEIRVISILDRITIKAQGAYLRKMEHMTFTSVVRQKTGNFWRADIYDKLGIESKEVKKKKRIGIYCRVSTREQTLGYSIDNQKNKCRDYMNLFNDDYVEPVFYIDEVILLQHLSVLASNKCCRMSEIISSMKSSFTSLIA